MVIPPNYRHNSSSENNSKKKQTCMNCGWLQVIIVHKFLGNFFMASLNHIRR
jgi:hypothetical protein